MIWPGKNVNGYGNLIAARLRNLGAARATGMLPFSGPDRGAMFFRDGEVIRVVSRRTPGFIDDSSLAALTPGSPLTRLTALATRAEPALDSALELLSGAARYGKFQPGESPPVELPGGIAVEELLTEVARRQRLLSRLAAALTPDTAVTRAPTLTAPAVRVSAAQWALLIRVRADATPRAIAWELRRSVFGTTLEAYRLLRLGLLSAPNGPGTGRDLSFAHAISSTSSDRPEREARPWPARATRHPRSRT